MYVSFSFKLCNTCIPCSILLQKRKNIACHRDNISCGLPCNNELPCVQHKCTKVCHSVSLLILLNVTTEQATRTDHNNNCFCSSLGSLSGRGGVVSTAVPQEEGKLQSPVYDPLSRRQSVSVHPLQSRGQLSFYCRITSQRSELLSLSLSLSLFISKYLLYIITSASVHPSPSFSLSLSLILIMMLLRGHLSLSLSFWSHYFIKLYDNHDNNKINHEIYWQRIISDYVVDINHVPQPTVYAKNLFLY